MAVCFDPVVSNPSQKQSIMLKEPRRLDGAFHGQLRPGSEHMLPGRIVLEELVYELLRDDRLEVSLANRVQVEVNAGHDRLML
jgi:hypothetical protein